MTRERLPQRRASLTFNLEHAGLFYTISLSHFSDGRPAECFVQNHMLSSAADIAARDSGILLSLLFQFGCPVETIAHAVTRNGDGSASGVVGAVIDRIILEAVP
jgi:ribonucleoside-diphosphate reductase alpha chain